MGTFPTSDQYGYATPVANDDAPKVPVVQLSQAPAETLIAQGRDTRQSAQDLQGLAKDVDTYALHLDTLSAQDALNKLRVQKDDLTFGKDNGFMNRKGGQVLDKTPDGKSMMESFPTRLLAEQEKIAGTLSGRARLMFDAHAPKEVEAYRLEMLRHTMNQTDVHRRAVFKDGAKQLEIDAVRHAGDLQQLDVLAARAETMARNEAKAMGEPADALVTELRSGVFATAISTKLAQNDISGAIALYGATKGKLAGKDEIVIGGKIKDAVDGRRVMADALEPLPPTPLLQGHDALSVVRQAEGLLFKPEKDTDGKWRIGYGSDEVTRADGTVVKVTEGMQITKEDAERDLARRAPIFQAGIREKIGEAAWNGLTPHAQASLTSIAYNYGSLPDRLVEAAKSGDPAKLSAAINALGGDNAGINRVRRAREAENVGKGSSPARGDAPPGQGARPPNADGFGDSQPATRPGGAVVTPPPEELILPHVKPESVAAPPPEDRGGPKYFSVNKETLKLNDWRAGKIAQGPERYGDDIENRKRYEATIENLYAQKKHQIDAYRSKLLVDKEEWLNAWRNSGKDPSALPPSDLYDQLSEADQKSLMNTMAAWSAGRKVVTDLTVWDTIQRGLTSRNPLVREEWADKSLEEYRSKLSPDDYQSLAKIQGTIRQGDPDKHATHVRNINQKTDDMLREMRVKTGEKATPADAKKASTFRRMVQENIAELEAGQNGKRATPEQQQKVIDDLSMKVGGTDGWFGLSQYSRRYELTIKDVPGDERAAIIEALKLKNKERAEIIEALKLKNNPTSKDVPDAERAEIIEALKLKNKPITEKAIVDWFAQQRRKP